jgi:hypothetical protein
MITFGDGSPLGDPTLELWEKASTPPGQDIGDAIDTTTFHNTRKTKWPRALIEDTDGSFTCAYDPLARTSLESIVGVNMEITVTFNDTSTWAFWGFMKSFTPQEVSDGEQPEAAVEFVVTNTDNAFVEQDPVVNEVAGT